MKPLVIIGYGNPLRSDDGIGWRAAHDLSQVWPAEAVRVEIAHQLAPEMAEWLAHAEYVIFIDASWGGSPGHIRSHPVYPNASGPGAWTHHLTPETLLAAAQELYGNAPSAVLFSVSGLSFEHGESLSPVVNAVYPELLKRVKTLVDSRIALGRPSRINAHA